MEFKNIKVSESKKITHDYKGNLIVPDNPIIPFIRWHWNRYHQLWSKLSTMRVQKRMAAKENH